MDLSFLDRISVLVVGDMMLDRYLWGEVHRISPEAPVPIVSLERETDTAGGAANVALNLAALGVRCELFGITGIDANGAKLAAILEHHRVHFDRRLARGGLTTITKTRILAQRQQLCRLDEEADPARYSVADHGLLGLLEEKARQYDAIILSDYAKGVIAQTVVDAVREARRRRPCFVALDPKPVRPLEIEGMDLLTPNRGEAAQLAGLPWPSRTNMGGEEVAEEICRRHQPGCLVVTLGEQGMLLRCSNSATQLVPTVARQVADVSGAGDTVVATLTAAMTAGICAETAVHIANAAAGVVVAKLGTATLSRAELGQALKADEQIGELVS